MQIMMPLSNAFRPDPRVAKEAKSLSEAGYDVRIVGWDRENEYPQIEEFDGYLVERIHDVPTKYGAGARQILYTPRFWSSAIKKVRKYNPRVIHCHDLDTLPIGWWAKKRMKCQLVYDAHEDYPALMSLYLPKPLAMLLSSLERFMLSKVDYTITASTVFAEKLQTYGFECVETIGNYQSLEPYKKLNNGDLKLARESLDLKPDNFVVAYIGSFSRNRLLLPLIEAAEYMPNVEVILWGTGHQQVAIQEATSRVENARYLGWLKPEHVPLYTQMADAIYYCILPDYPGAIYNAPNALTNAMAAGRPIIANDIGDLGRIVRQTDCGKLIHEVTPDSINQAVTQLRETNEYTRLGQAAYQAARSTFNWKKAEEKLIKVYDRIIQTE
jgi:glycosyltransferase involved in cell wall biosynthesis